MTQFVTILQPGFFMGAGMVESWWNVTNQNINHHDNMIMMTNIAIV
jgi:hypothetical protein